MNNVTATSGNKLEKLDALRGFAAIYVVLHHAVPHDLTWAGIDFGFVFRFGQEAVTLFFLLSGFVINYSFRRGADHTFKTYLVKRACRIYLPLLCVMLLGWLLECLSVGGLGDIRPRELFLNLLMLQDIAALKPNVIVAPYMDNSPLWSLSYEWWFYMLYFPMQKIFLTDRYRNLTVYMLALGAAVLYLVEPVFVVRLVMYLSIWWTGVFISNLYLDDKRFSAFQLTMPVLFLSLICVVNGYSVLRAIQTGQYQNVGVHPVLELRQHLFALIVICVALFWRKLKWTGFNFLFHPFLYIAPISFGLYISHYYFVIDPQFFSFVGNQAVEKVLYMLAMLIFAYFIEMQLFPRGQNLIFKYMHVGRVTC
jgi:peptidoglycan/LPS O-acetylase OafA/YrhL